MRLIINIPDAAQTDANDLVARATTAFGRCRVEVDRLEGAIEAVQAADSEQFAVRARGYLALAKRHGQPLNMVGFRFSVSPDRANALCNAMRDSVGGQCRAEDIVYCDSHSQLLMLLPQTPETAAVGFCQRMIHALQGAAKTIGFSHPERIVYCALVAHDAARHGTVAEMLHELYTALEQAYQAQRTGEVVRPAVA